MSAPPDQPANTPGSEPEDREQFPRRPGGDIAATVSREVRVLRERVERYTRLHNDLSAEVAENLAPGLAALQEDYAEQVGRLQAQVDQILDTLGQNRNRPVNWPALTAEEAQEEWQNLARWIAEVFVPWYQVTRKELPDCWALHRPALMELSWLRSAHIEAYLRNSTPHIAGEWHARWRPTVLARLEAIIPRTLCRPGEHMVPEEDSARRAEDPSQASRRPEPWEPRSPGQRRPLAAQQLAEAQHWAGFYEQAMTADLAWRRQREMEAQQRVGGQ